MDSVNGVGCGDNGSNGGGGEEANGVVDGVGSEEKDDVVFLYSQFEKTMGEPCYLGFELCKGEGLRRMSIYQSGFGWKRRNALEEKRNE